MLGLGLPATLCGVGGIDDDGLLLLVMNAPVPFAITQVLLVPVRTFLVQSLVLTALTTGLFAAVSLRGGVLAGVVPATLFGCLLVLVSVRPGVWSLSVMWQAEKARDLQARLAVAEERLRFGRDMHDVLGRNLAVIALKSELAVELAQRGRAEAVDQMVEVQRIARASQQEVRDVVRGYREVDLSTELVGAQGVLKAAGIVCEVTGDGGGQLPAAVQSALGWAVREAATNVLRHGDPGSARSGSAFRRTGWCSTWRTTGHRARRPGRAVPGWPGCGSGWAPSTVRWTRVRWATECSG